MTNHTASLTVFMLCQAAAIANVQIATVPISNPGNLPDHTGFGAVGYSYDIATYEVTARQYTDFLNAVASSDPYDLYSPEMYGQYGCGIRRNGLSGKYAYTVSDACANRPVNYVSWADAARFANWMHNGCPTGRQNANSTEDGSYFLDGATEPKLLQTVSRQPDATWVLPTEDEWYKSAYHKNDGATDSYFNYPTSSDIAPCNDWTAPDIGNNATFFDAGYTIGPPYYRTEAGAHANSTSPYGTFDQGGNISEWNEAVEESYRCLRGGSFNSYANSLLAQQRTLAPPTTERIDIGFRLACIPEPHTAALLVLLTLTICRRKRRD